jgi:hypothetical protein
MTFVEGPRRATCPLNEETKTRVSKQKRCCKNKQKKLSCHHEKKTRKLISKTQKVKHTLLIKVCPRANNNGNSKNNLQPSGSTTAPSAEVRGLYKEDKPSSPDKQAATKELGISLALSLD